MKILKKPTLFEMTMGLFMPILLSIFNNKVFTTDPPKKIGKYRLLKKIEKNPGPDEFGLGVYRFNNKKYFIKTWSGAIKDFRYYPLVQEYFMKQFLYKKVIDNGLFNNKYQIKLPRVIEYFQSKQSISIVFEYIEGKSLTLFHEEKKIDVLIKTLSFLNEINSLLTDNEKKQLPTRTKLFYYITLPFFTLFSIASNPSFTKPIIKAFIDCLRSINCLNIELTLAHRDLGPHNIILHDNEIYLIDCGRMVLTISDFDFSYMKLLDLTRSFAPKIEKNFGKKSNIFLENYILIQNIKFHGRLVPNNFYLKELNLRYG